MTAVPAKIPKASPLVVENPRNVPNAGKIKAARTLKKKMTEMDCATSSSSAPMTGAAAAMADPPQMEDPTPMRVAVLSGILNARRRIAASNSAVQMVPTMIGRDCFPVCRMTVRLRPNPSRTTAHWSTFLETKVIPLLNGSFFFKNRVTIMPIRMEKTGPPTTGTALPKNHAGMAMARQSRMPAVFFAKNCCNVFV